MADHLSSAISAIYRCSKQKQVATLAPNTKLIRTVLLLLIRLGYLAGFTVVNPYKLRIFIKFDENKNPVLRSLTRVSKGGARVYISYKKLLILNRNVSAVDSYKFLILSTPRGILTTREAVLFKEGGEILAVVN